MSSPSRLDRLSPLALAFSHTRLDSTLELAVWCVVNSDLHGPALFAPADPA